MQFSAEQVKAILDILSSSAPKVSEDGKPSGVIFIDGGKRKVIVRSRDAGVQYGELISYTADGSLVNLANARQMWSWTAKEGGTLLDCANHGVKSGKFSTVTPSMVVIGACAIIDVSDKAIESLESAKWA